MQKTFAISIFNNRWDNEAKPFPTTLDELLSDPPRADSKDDLPAWSPAAYRNEERGKLCVTAVAALVFDVDRCTAEEFQSVKERVAALGYQYAIHTTFTSAPTAPKFRVIFPLEKRVNYATHAALWHKLVPELQVAVDSTKIGAESLFFLPVIPPQGGYEGVFDDKLPCLDALALVEAQPDGPVVDEDHHELTEEEVALVFQGSDQGPEIAKWIQTIKDAQDGEKRVVLNTAALNIGRLFEWSGKGKEALDTARRLCLDALKGKKIDDWSHAERTVDIAFNDGWVEARSKRVQRAKWSGKAGKSLAIDPRIVRQAEQLVEKTVKKLNKQLDKNHNDLGAVVEASTRLGAVAGILGEEQVQEAILNETRGVMTVSEEEIKRVSKNSMTVKPAPLLDSSAAWRSKLKLNADGTGYAKSDYNLAILLANYPGQEGNVRMNTRSNEIEWEQKTFWAPSNGRKSVDEQRDKVDLMLAINDALDMSSFATNVCFAALDEYAGKHMYDPWLEYLKKCEAALPEVVDYDVLERAMIVPLRLEDNDYHRKVACYFLASSVRRTIRPGAEVHCVPVFVSPEHGSGKSFWAKRILGRFEDDCWTEAVPEDDRTNAEQFEKMVIVEWGELAGANKKDNARMKQFISAKGAFVRAAYARKARNFRRRAVLVGTTNEQKFIGDETGGRRFWPVNVGGKHENVEGYKWLAENLDTIWGLAYRWVKEGRRFYFAPEDQEAVTELQIAARVEFNYSERVEEFTTTRIKEKWEKPPVKDLSIEPGFRKFGEDPKEKSKVREYPGQWVDGRIEFFTTSQVMVFLDIEDSSFNRRTVQRTAASLGWITKNKKVHGKQLNAWFRK